MLSYYKLSVLENNYILDELNIYIKQLHLSTIQIVSTTD